MSLKLIHKPIEVMEVPDTWSEDAFHDTFICCFGCTAFEFKNEDNRIMVTCDLKQFPPYKEPGKLPAITCKW